MRRGQRGHEASTGQAAESERAARQPGGQPGTKPAGEAIIESSSVTDGPRGSSSAICRRIGGTARRTGSE
jgi:hypothetical protein